MRQFTIMTVLTLSALSSSVFAKPMMSPSPSEAAASPWIIEGEYLGYEKAVMKPAAGNDPDQMPFILSFKKSDDFAYFQGPYALYKVTRIFKQTPGKQNIKVAATIHVSYQFHDGSACMEPPSWKFSPKMMPEARSKWILFLTPTDPHFGSGTFGTYRGDYGRWPATEENARKLQALLKPVQHD